VTERILLLLLALTTPGAAQVSATAALSVADRYVWRGVTRVNGWVLQPLGAVEVGLGPGVLAATIWGNYEVTRAGAGDLSDVGRDRRGFGEANLELSAGTDAGPLALTAGWIRYTYHGDSVLGGRSAGTNTSELFAAVAWRASRVAPELILFRDIGTTRAYYAELAATLPVFASPEPRPAAVISLRPLAGWSVGPGPDRGLTHLDVPLALDLEFAGAHLESALSVRLHAQWNRDAATRVTDAAGGSARVKLWTELVVSGVVGPDRRRRR
jgi:hypothetical protein